MKLERTLLNLFIVIVITTLDRNVRADVIGNLYENSQKCIEKAVSHHFKNKPLALYFPKQNEINLNMIGLLESRTTTIFSESNIYSVTSNNMLIFIRSIEDLTVINTLEINSRKMKLFAVVLTTDMNEQNELLTSLIAIFVKLGIHSTVLAINNKNHTTDFYSWNPFSSKERCGQSKGFSRTNSCYKGKYSKPLASLAKPSFNHNFNNFILKIGWLYQDSYVMDPSLKVNPGIFISLMNVIGELTNIHILYEKRNKAYEKELYLNGTTSEIIEALKSSTSDVALGRFYINNQRKFLEHGPVFYKDYFTVVTRKPEKLKVYRNLLLVFTSGTWLIACLVLFLTFGIAIVLYKYYKIYFFYTFVSVLDAYGVHIGQGIKVIPNSTPARIFYSFFFLYCLNINSLYLGKLSSIFATPNTDVAIKETYDLLINNVTTYVTIRMECELNFSHFYRGPRKGHPTYIITNSTEYDNLKQIACRRANSSIIFNSVYNNHPLLQSRVDSYFIHLLNITMLGTYYLRQSNPINHALYYWTQELIEKGFVGKWRKDVADSYQEPACALHEEELETVVKLKLAHYEEAFIILISGYVLSIITLAFEFLARWIDMKRKKFLERLSSFPEFYM